MSEITSSITTKVTLKKQDNEFYLILGSKKIKVPKKFVANPESMFDDSEVFGELKLEAIFDFKQRKNGKMELIPESLSVSGIEFSLDSHVELSNFTEDAEYFAQGDLFAESLCEIIDYKLSIGEYSDQSTRENMKWEEGETMVALRIYNHCSAGSGDLSDEARAEAMALASELSFDGADDNERASELSPAGASFLETLKAENPDGYSNIEKRSYNSIKMKIFTFPAMEVTSSQTGLKNTSKLAEKLFKESQKKD